MTRTTITRTIEAPVEAVFEAVADISNFARAVPDIARVEFLTESRVGVGSRFRETRVMRGREASTVLEVTEYVRNERVRLVADAGGTVWDSLSTVVGAGEDGRRAMLELVTVRDRGLAGLRAVGAGSHLGDTTVVRSRGPGMWGATADLVPEVSIGELEGPDEYLFGIVGAIAVDDDRAVYVLDTQAQHVSVFDSTGTYVETLGRRGEGPAELSRGEAIAMLPDGRLLVRDPANMRIQVFGPGPGETDDWRYNSRNHFTDAPLDTDSRGRAYLAARTWPRAMRPTMMPRS